MSPLHVVPLAFSDGPVGYRRSWFAVVDGHLALAGERGPWQYLEAGEQIEVDPDEPADAGDVVVIDRDGMYTACLCATAPADALVGPVVRRILPMEEIGRRRARASALRGARDG